MSVVVLILSYPAFVWFAFEIRWSTWLTKLYQKTERKIKTVESV
ncbi:hypothetical protein B4113_2392 [Geobacillus sp. B4113_201601]|nr:hypothetical protein B4113_2392 [Geobacillus sp. B4113_201601]